MCIIIHKPKGIDIDPIFIANSDRRNPDGFGYMYYDPDTDRIVSGKSIKWPLKKIQKIIKELKDFEACFHFRIKTHGAVADKQCHPFRITKKATHGQNLLFMHNGIIRITSTNSDLRQNESDTQAYNRKFLHPILRNKPSLIKSPSFRSLLKESVGTSKLCFMFGKGEVFFVNKKLGVEKEGCWFSNSTSFSVVQYSDSYYNSNNYNGNYNNKNLNRQTAAMLNVHIGRDGSITEQNNCGATGIKSPFSVPFVDFCGENICVGDKISVLAPKEDSKKESAADMFHSAGKVVEINSITSFITFEDESSIERRVAFHNKDGTCVYSQGVYFAIPESKNNTNSLADNITDISKVKEKNKEKQSKDYSIKDLKNKLTKKKEEADKKSTSSKEIKEEKYLDSSSIVDYSDCIFYGEYVTDDSSRCGGETLTGSVEDLMTEYQDYDKTYNFLEVYDMSSQERFEFFLDHWEPSFHMFQDLIEYFVINDFVPKPKNSKIVLN